MTHPPTRRATLAPLLLVVWACGHAPEPPAPQAGIVALVDADSATLTGRLARPDGVPLAGARVSLIGTDHVVLTRAEGEFAFRLPPGEYRLRAEEYLYPVDERTVRLGNGDSVHLDVVLDAGVVPQSPTDLAGDPRVAWLRDNAVAVHTIDPADAHFDDLDALRDVIGDARIVLLAEPSHLVGSAFLAKSRIVRFLHERMGFDVLAWESGLHAVPRAWQQVRAGAPAHEPMGRGVFGVWSRLAELDPLEDYIEARARTDRPLEITGFDSQVPHPLSRELLVSDLRAFARRLGLPDSVLADSGTLALGLQGMTRYEAPGDDALHALAALRTAAMAAAADDTTLATAYGLQLLQSLVAEAHSLRGWQPGQPVIGGPAGGWPDANIRDFQMAENLVWLAQRAYPGRKIVVWAAASHVMKPGGDIDAFCLAFPTDCEFRNMGHWLYQALPAEQIHDMGFIAQQGTIHNPVFRGMPASPVASHPAHVQLEDLLAAAGFDYALLDLRDGAAWLRQPIVAVPVANRPALEVWPDYFDSLFFIRDMRPATLSPRAP